MISYSPTIEELKRKSPRELDAIFRRAAEIAANKNASTQERAVAIRTMEAVKRCADNRHIPQ